jgi:NADH dehydrogenase
LAFEEAERSSDAFVRKKPLTFKIVGGGPPGVELAGAIGEMTRFTLAKDFRSIDAKLARIMLIEASPRILPMFSQHLAGRAARYLESLGVQIWTGSKVSSVDQSGVQVGNEHVDAGTVLWAAGVEDSALGKGTGAALDRNGRVMVEPDLSRQGHPNVFVAGDMALCKNEAGKPLPGMARCTAPRTLPGQTDRPRDPRAGPQAISIHGQGANGHDGTEPRDCGNRQVPSVRAIGLVFWLVVHIFYLSGFRNRLFVVVQRAWSYFTFRRGARLIIDKEWRFHGKDPS